MPSLRVIAVGKPAVYEDLFRVALPGSGAYLFESLEATEVSRAVEILGQGGSDLVLLAEDSTSQVLEQLALLFKADRKAAVVILGQQYDADAASACLRCGAQDYVGLHPLDPQTLSHALLHAWERNALRHAPQVPGNAMSTRLEQTVTEANQLSARMQEEAAERIRAEKALVETVAHYRFLLDSLPQIVWTTDPNGALVFLNTYWAQYSGRSIEDTLREGWGETIHPEDQALAKERWRHSLRTGEPFEMERRLRSLNGDYGWHRSRAVPRRNPAGQILEWIGTEAFIDDQKRVRERLQEAHDELGIRILQRTSELAHANESLQAEVAERRRAEIEAKKAREIAETANRTKTEFLANISHEIRTPMNGIIGMMELALETNLDAQQRDYLQLVAQSADSLLTLINDMLDFAKIEAGRIELENELFSLRDVLGDAVKVTGIRAAQKGLKMKVECAPEVPRMIFGDSLRVRQIMLNLLGNSVKFTEQGEVAVRVSAVSSHGDFVNLLVEVSDNGIGIPDDKQQTIFEAFAQVDGSMTRRFGGTGLGLAIVSSLVKQMGGDIRVRSKLGEGSTFSFNLPARVEPNAGIHLGAPVIDSLIERYKSLRVLVVAEGRMATGFALAEILKSMRLDASLIRFGEEALYEVGHAESQGSPYRLIIVDADLGDMTGYEFIQALADRGKRKAPIILLVSGSVSAAELKQAQDLKPERILYKPITQPDVVESVIRTMQQAEPVRVDSQPGPHAPKSRGAKPPLRVLVAEDNPVNLAVAERMLMSFGCTVVKATNGREAVAAVDREPFDLILMDIQMPEMDGMEATRVIRLLPDERANLPIIAMTAHAMKGDRERFLAAGLDHYISKPFHKDELLLLVKSIVSRVWRGESVVQKTPEPGASMLSGLMRSMGGDKALFLRACDLFAELMPGLTAELGAALDENHAHEAERLARNLKSSLDSVGAREISEQVTVMEANLRACDYPGAVARFEAIQGDIHKILVEIAQVKKANPTEG